MTTDVEILIPYSSATAVQAAELARQVAQTSPVIVTGDGPISLASGPGIQVITDQPGKGRALREAFSRLSKPIALIHQPPGEASTSDHQNLCRPIAEGQADAVYGVRPNGAHLLGRGLARLSRAVTEASVGDLLSGRSAFRSEVLKGLTLSSEGDEVDSEILIKVAAQMYRISEVELAERRPLTLRDWSASLAHARTMLRYATTHNDTDNLHEGYNTLSRMEGGAPNYNAWLGDRFREHCGARVLEIGAGIGTITAQLEAGRELLIALEVDPFYVKRLENRFRGKPHVRPYLSDVALADWESLRRENIDSIVLSNVLEHIPDDVGALRRFRQILPVGGRLIILVPALPALFGSMDEAVGHYRRYTDFGLRGLLEKGGFEVQTLEWMNLAGIPGWFVNGRIFRRRSVPPLQLRVYDQIAPMLARAESKVRLPIGMSLFAVAKVV